MLFAPNVRNGEGREIVLFFSTRVELYGTTPGCKKVVLFIVTSANPVLFRWKTAS